ncbi:hypothetical protein CYMTET_42004 [Cymbomonas tetramitiformis]|uniref:DUF2341 domain-containing protein n=1 Tax=Cymbomonas tetramitiformis TaxID=36881 RepID=A0AAE0C503_9CHLO|nr:hypothetical protein CYMTET_42004 [Cymbomonas tetramitiformis]
MTGVRRSALILCCITLFAAGLHAETLLQLNGETSYIQAYNYVQDSTAAGTFSLSLWVWPERRSHEMEAIVSLADSSLKSSMTIGWSEGRFYYTDDIKVEPIVSNSTFDRKTWHSIVLTLEPVDKSVVVSDGSFAHRRGVLYVDYQPALEFDTRLPNLSKAQVTVGCEYKREDRRRFFTGVVDELRLYNKTLSQSEATSIPFIKPSTSDEYASNFLTLYSAFKDITKSDITDQVVTTSDVVGGYKVKVHYCDKVEVAIMPYDAIALSSYTKENIFKNNIDHDGSASVMEGGLSGATITVTGVNFANTFYTKAFVDGDHLTGQEIEVKYVDTSTLILYVPSVEMTGDDTLTIFGETVNVRNSEITVSNGGSNSASFMYTFFSVLGEDLSTGLVAYYDFKNTLANTADLDDSSMTASTPSDYGEGGPFYAADKNGYPTQALKFVRGERVEVSPFFGEKNYWTFCSWLYAEDTARTLYYERNGHRVSNLIQLDEDGTLYLDGEVGASIIFNTWQFVCVVKDNMMVHFYTGGELKASASSVSNSNTMTKGLIGTNFTGIIDDVWAFDTAVDAYTIQSMYSSEDYAVELDGDNTYFTITNLDDQFHSEKWRGSNTFSVEVYAKVYSTDGYVPLWYEPSEFESTVTQSLTSEQFDGNYLVLQDGKIVFFNLVDSGTSGTGSYIQTSTASAVITANTWFLVTATFSGTEVSIYLDGVAQSVEGNKMSSAADSHALGATYSLESSPQGIIVGCGEQYTVYSGCMDGLIGEVRLWSKALTSSEVSTGYTCPLVNGQSGLYALFRMDEGTGSVLSGGSDALRMTFSSTDKLPYWVASNYTQATDTTSLPTSPVTGPAAVSGVVDEANIFSFQAKDSCERLRKYETQAMQVVLAGPLDRHQYTTTGTITANGDGTYTGTYTHMACGFWSMRVETTEVPVDATASSTYDGTYSQYMAKNSPLKVYLNAGPTSAAASYAFDAPDLLDNNDLATAYYGAPAAFTVQATDQYGCKKTKGGDMFEVFLTGRYNTEGVSTDNGDGTYTLTYVPMTSGPIQLNVNLGGMPVGTEGPVDPKDSCGLSLGTDYAGSPWMIDVMQGSGALVFDGSNYVAVPDDDQLDIPGFDYTLEAWVWPIDPFDAGRIISKESPYVGHGYWLAIQDMKVETGLYVGGDAYREIRSEVEVAPNTWSHIAATYDGNTLILYINGEMVQSKKWDTKMDFKENSQKVIIGKGFTGAVDEVRITAETKSQVMIAMMMKCPVANNTVALYLMLNDGAGEVAYDYSSYGSHGALKGNPLPDWFEHNAPYAVNEIDFEGSEMSGSGLTEATVGVTASVTMNLVDMCGLPYSVISSVEQTVQFQKFTLYNDAHDNLSYPLINYENTGEQKTYFDPDIFGLGEILLTYTPEVCGDTYVGIEVDGMSPAASPYPVKVYSLAETHSSTSFISGMAGAVAGLETSFMITAGDRYGCKRTTGGDQFEVLLTRTSAYGGGSMSGAETVSAKLSPVDNSDGTYTVYYTAPIGGEYVIDVGFDNEDGSGILPVMHSPHEFITTPAPWRQYLLDGVSPAPRYEPTTVVYDDELYVFNGWGSDKTAVTDVWKYDLSSANTWSYRMPITITNLKSSHEVKIVVDTEALVGGGKMKSDCTDVRFVAEGDVEVGYWLDGTPGCGGKQTGFWIIAPSFPTTSLIMYYGNAQATSTALPAKKIFASYDDFEDGDPFENGWEMMETCSFPHGDEASFSVKEWSSSTGSMSLEVDTIDKAGGSIMKRVEPLTTYILKADFYDSDSETSSHWISPNFDDCTELYNDKISATSSGLGLGVYTCSTTDFYSMLYPWGNTHVGRTAGWHSLEFVCDGENTYLYVDATEVPDTKKVASTINKIFIRGGGPPRAGEDEFASLAAWDNVYVAHYDPEVVVEMTGDEEAVIWKGKDWSLVKTKGASPPARSTDAAVLFEDKLYMLGGYGSMTADSLVWYYDFPKAKFGSMKPWGSANLPARQGHSMSLYEDTIYVFGGRSETKLVYSDLWAYSITDNAWKMIAEDTVDGPSGRFGHTAAVYKDMLYVFGGYAAGGASGETWSYSMTEGTWADMTPVVSPPPRFSHTLAIQGDSMFIYGGSTGDEVLEDTWRYDFDYNAWIMVEAASSMGNSSQRSDLGVAVSNNTMYVFGGYDKKSCLSDFWSMAVY